MLLDYCNSFMRIFYRIKYVVIYYMLGSKAILHDLLYKRRNRVELKRKSNYVAVVTGGARGIGSNVVKMLMQCDMHVVIGCREVAIGHQMIQQIRKAGINTGSASVLELDLTSLKSVQKFASIFNSQHEYLNLLVNNAGIMFAPYEETIDGLESHFSVNYLGHFLLTLLFLPAMKVASKMFDKNPRVVNVSSCAHEVSPEINFEDLNMKNGFITQAAYSQSKLCQIMFTKTLDRKLKEKDSNIQVIAVHPGVVNTELFNGTLVKLIAPWVLTLFGKTAEQGATTVSYCCIDEKLEHGGGSYVSNCSLVSPSIYVNDLKTQEKLYNVSMQLVKPFLSE